jgi:lysine-N-methylase
MPASPHITPRYMTRFACTGPACPDSCCAAGWGIAVDERHYKKLKSAMDGSAGERERFREAHKRARGVDRDGRAFARLRLLDDGRCTLLGRDGLCSTQATYGEALLPDTCAVYPRTVSRVGTRLELTASLSCPEVARLCLLADDATELAPLDPAVLPRPFASQVCEAPAHAYERHLDDVRAVVLELLALRELPLASRLFLVTHLAHRTAPFFHRDARGDMSGALAHELSAALDPVAALEKAVRFAALEVPASLAAQVVVWLLERRLGSEALPVFRKLVASVIARYREEGVVAGDTERVTVDPVALFAAYALRRAAWQASEARVDLYFENYARNYWLREWYVRARDLVVHSRRLLVSVAVLRFLLLSRAPTRPLDELAVETFYTFSRGVEHCSGFLEHIVSSLEERQMTTLAHDVYLMKL